MYITDSMPNFNQKNPFVISCSAIRDEIDVSIFNTGKIIMTSSMIVAVMILQTVLCLVATRWSDRIFGQWYYHIIYILIGVELMLLITHLLVIYSFRKNILKSPVRKDADDILKAQMSEVRLMNNEVLFNIALTMREYIGEIKTVGRHCAIIRKCILVESIVMLIVVVTEFII